MGVAPSIPRLINKICGEIVDFATTYCCLACHQPMTRDAGIKIYVALMPIAFPVARGLVQDA